MADCVGLGSFTWNDRFYLVGDFYAATAAVNVWQWVTARDWLSE
jgi:hypothetical protein